jgi:cellobiose-specific phosphotransferase system component IIA
VRGVASQGLQEAYAEIRSDNAAEADPQFRLSETELVVDHEFVSRLVDQGKRRVKEVRLSLSLSLSHTRTSLLSLLSLSLP